MGTCADQGYTVQTGTQTMKVPVSGDTCGQSDLDCNYVGPAKAFRSSLKDGTCADQGYTVQTGTQTMKVPVIGDITVTQYSKGLMVADTCSLYEISGDTCGQSDLDCNYVGPA